jgi:hypothetical protein
MKDMNKNMPKSGTAKGGGGAPMKTRSPNGDQNMPMGKVDRTSAGRATAARRTAK